MFGARPVPNSDSPISVADWKLPQAGAQNRLNKNRMRSGDIRTRDATGSKGTVLVQLQSLTCLGGVFGDRCLSQSCQYIMDHDSRSMSWTPYTFMQTAEAEERPNAV